VSTNAGAPTAADRSIAVWIPPLCDLLVVTLFVLIGRRSHDEGSTVAGFLRVWWPFAAGLGVSGVLSGAWWYPLRWARVVGLWLGTLAVGMLLRISIQGREFKPSFVIVTAVFFGLGMFGWRVIAKRAVTK
jgi:hypothetical protein